MNAQAPRYIASHTAMRGIAALIVVGYHLKFGEATRLPLETATNLFERGYLWVDFFFILSGFVLTHVYGGNRPLPSGEGLKAFYRARFARIYPLHAFALALLVLFKLATSGYAALTQQPSAAFPEAWTTLPANILLVQSYGFYEEPTWNIPAWSISTEVVAYIVFPVLLMALMRRPLLASAAFMGAATVFYGAVAATTGSLDIPTGLAIVRCLSGFGLGMVLCRLTQAGGSISRSVASTLQMAALLSIVVFIEAVDNDVALIVPFAVLVYATAHDEGRVATALRWRPLHALGEWSYSIYLLHVPTILAVGFVSTRVFGVLGMKDTLVARTIFVISVFAVTVAASAFVYQRVERPARRFIVRRT